MYEIKFAVWVKIILRLSKKINPYPKCPYFHRATASKNSSVPTELFLKILLAGGENKDVILHRNNNM
jgi:hypothetical protein